MPITSGIYYFSHQEDNYTRPAVILIHGVGGNHLYWPPEVRRLNGQRILAVDLPGHGKSNGVGKQTIEDYASEIIAFMDAARLRKAIFIGHSMGSAIALQLAISHPSRTLALGLLGSGAVLRVNSEIMNNAAAPATFLMAIHAIHDYGFPADFDARLKELSIKRMTEIRPSVLHGDLLACDSFDVREHLYQIRARALIMTGSLDRLTPVRYAEFLDSKIRKAELHIIDGAGHMLMLERPNLIAEKLSAFVDTIPYRPGE